MSSQPVQRRHRSRGNATSNNKEPSVSWSDATQIAANQQQVITPQQLAMLKGKLELAPAGFTAILSLLTIIPLFLLATMLDNEEILFLFALPLGLILFLLVLPYRKRADRLRAASASGIVREQGEVVWQNNKYIARTPTRQLVTAYNNLGLPSPGPYHFYYLPEKAILLSAEPIRTYTGMITYPGSLSATGLPGREQARIALQDALCQTLHFNVYDLDCNRKRMLSQGQQQRLYRKLFWKVVGSLIGISIGVTLLCCGFALQANSHDSNDLPLLIFLYYISASILLGSLYFLIRGSRVRYREIRQAELTILMGLVHTYEEEGDEDTPTRYYFKIDTTTIQVKEPVYKALIPNNRYQLYYLPRMNELVSIEPLI